MESYTFYYTGRASVRSHCILSTQPIDSHWAMVELPTRRSASTRFIYHQFLHDNYWRNCRRSTWRGVIYVFIAMFLLSVRGLIVAWPNQQYLKGFPARNVFSGRHCQEIEDIWNNQPNCNLCIVSLSSTMPVLTIAAWEINITGDQPVSPIVCLFSTNLIFERLRRIEL